ncbi:histamine H3 receptor [Bombina bombina]|uniref:histamine H3 receptor n=1 Tax=Bombina bombina TaxID=8345 RepID=UPI00235AB88A|nr:histamine H3 receptor [Bombina bombina]
MGVTPVVECGVDLIAIKHKAVYDGYTHILQDLCKGLLVGWEVLETRNCCGAEMDSSQQNWPHNDSVWTSADVDDRYPGNFTFSWTVFLAILMGILIVTTVLGNALVMLAFLVDSSLRTQNNYFLLNLAISDFLVGALCIPLYVPYVLTGRWSFGRHMCKLWLVLDYLLCTSSVFNIVLISYDRFISVTRAVSYRAQQSNSKHAVLKMSMVWLLAFLLYGPAIITWEYIAGRSIIPEGECFAEFFYNWYFLITASTLEFFTPFISVTFFNVSIYMNIQRRTKSRLDVLQETQSQTTMEDIKVASEPPRTSSLKCWKQKILKNGHHGTSKAKDAEMLSKSKSTRRSFNESCSNPSLEKRMRIVSQGIAQRFRLSRDKKIAKSLAVIVCIFGLCWAPYTLLMIIRAACRGHCVPEVWYEVSFWLLWINSAVNPILYPLCHYSFKRAFKKILCPQKLKIKPHSKLQHCWK